MVVKIVKLLKRGEKMTKETKKQEENHEKKLNCGIKITRKEKFSVVSFFSASKKK